MGDLICQTDVRCCFDSVRCSGFTADEWQWPECRCYLETQHCQRVFRKGEEELLTSMEKAGLQMGMQALMQICIAPWSIKCNAVESYSPGSAHAHSPGLSALREV